ncbi:hypothetical protein, partial [Acinetobacter baumannii]|uniref:hypothetical protein n=1 Tax=Acinetobacter baumannii TaxID=470 RepID=UPI003EBB8186
VIYDINGREAVEVEPILDALPKLEQFIYCSSAGVYLKSDLLPHFETDAVDPKSRHKGKAPITQQLPGESDQDYEDFKSKILHLKGDRKDFEFVKTSLAAK